jgi:aryl-alcohol dehydrogenase-like predicted oxidoreductase
VTVVPIPGTKRLRYLEENVAALDVRLPVEAMARIDALSPRVRGLRHPQMDLTSAGGRP